MIRAAEIVCRVASESAVKGSELYCSTVNPVNSADSQTWATWASAFATFGLLVLAVFAWRSSRSQIRLMRDESKEATRRNQELIQANQNLEDRRNMQESIFDYLGAHADMFAAGSRSMEEVNLASVQLRKSSLRFIMLHEFPGRSGEIANFDDVAIMLTKSAVRNPRDRDLSRGRNMVFNQVNGILRDLNDGRLDGGDVHGEFQKSFSELVKEYDIYLPASLVNLARRRGLLDD
ncbi:hypothetical protein [Zhihengliuella halotolerans]|uniref:hypothetical protein n=1 Tax=Zhihengliuella halotolerans TaxID=370736 RepID=UPI0011AEF9DC|nr:hypothetical protein [Zhihengliuella halotolerans]